MLQLILNGVRNALFIACTSVPGTGEEARPSACSSNSVRDLLCAGEKMGNQPCAQYLMLTWACWMQMPWRANRVLLQNQDPLLQHGLVLESGCTV